MVALHVFLWASLAGLGAAVNSSAPVKADCSTAPASLRQGPSSTVYFGCGCFWHGQHAWVTCAEEGILGRSGSEVTSFPGYAGSTDVGEGGRVCYHNPEQLADYSVLGFGEVTSLEMPHAAAERIFEFYFTGACVNAGRLGIRFDLDDVGPQYRTLVGFPGGIDSDLGKRFVAVAAAYDVQAKAGDGSDSDEVGTIWVMDSNFFPYHQAEIYHMFHDDVIDKYGNAYHQLAESAMKRGVIRGTKCPRDATGPHGTTLYERLAARLNKVVTLYQ